MMIYAPEVGATGQAPAAAPAQAQAPARHLLRLQLPSLHSSNSYRAS